ncbi:MAG: hypothetical protein JWP12_3833 [Bacteroidetes bacterium]|nr:hypothetical protein [Bacteroidota bacterium]
MTKQLHGLYAMHFEPQKKTKETKGETYFRSAEKNERATDSQIKKLKKTITRTFKSQAI